MQADFWHQKWQRGETAFHLDQPNPLLLTHIDRLKPQAGACWFLPLCGKSLDIGWLLAQGYQVKGVELSPLAIQVLFEQFELTPEVKDLGSLQRYSAAGLEIFVGDLFVLDAAQLGPVDLIFDRAALVALPAETRQQYAQHLMQLSACAPQLLITYEFDQALRPGPPFSVPPTEVSQLYAGPYQLQHLAETSHTREQGQLQITALETVWLLQP